MITFSKQMTDSSTEEECIQTLVGSSDRDTQTRNTQSTTLPPLPLVSWCKFDRLKSARHWTFEVYDLDVFDWNKLAHKNGIYRVCQKQSIRGYDCYYGVLAFNTKVSYACIHNLIGGGEYCWIHPAYAPHKCRTKCFSKQTNPVQETLEFGKPPASYLGKKFNKANFKQQQYRKSKAFRAANPHVTIKN